MEGKRKGMVLLWAFGTVVTFFSHMEQRVQGEEEQTKTESGD